VILKPNEMLKGIYSKLLKDIEGIDATIFTESNHKMGRKCFYTANGYAEF
jgi:hypothetical protein